MYKFIKDKYHYLTNHPLIMPVMQTLLVAIIFTLSSLTTSIHLLTVGFICVFGATNLVFFLYSYVFFADGITKEIPAFFTTIVSAAFANVFIFANLYFTAGVIGEIPGTNETGVIKDYATSFYFSIVTWTTLGYGDLKPIYELRLVAAVEALMGYLYMAIIVGMLFSQSSARTK